MDGNSDYLTLWTHYENRGFDDKNRMISTASLLIGFAGAMLGASISSPQPATAAGLAILSGLTALLSAATIKLFKIHAGRNFKAADMIQDNLDDGLKAILARTRPAPAPVSILNFVNWLSLTRPGSATGRIFGFFSAISLSVAVVSVVVLLTTSD
jgi:hypothetical protein